MRSETISYIDYYKKQYDITIRDYKQPLLMCKSKQKEISGKTNLIYLIPELCCMTGLTDEMRADFNVMRDLSQHTRLDPAMRVNNLMRFIDRINKNEQIQKEMNGWGIKFSSELVKIDARVFEGEKILHKGGIQSMYNPVTADFSKEIRGKEMYSSQDLKNWLIIIAQREENRAEDFIQNLIRVCLPMGMKVSRPQALVLRDDRTNSFLNAIRSASPQVQMIVIIVPNNRKDRYDAIKKLACIDMGVPTQVIVSRTLAKKQMLMSVATKIGIQLNCKLGGEPWAVDIPIKKVPLMIIGFDTYHDASRRGHSVGGFVASLNETLTKWYSQISVHETCGWQELSDKMALHLSNALHEYQKHNKFLPQIILMYRDGVSNGQVNHVREYELVQLKSTIKRTYGKEIRFGFIIVNKRISTRFFKYENNEMGNPLPGTVIDSDITRPTRYDFFLVSQSVRQGTVSPTQYNVIYDTSLLPPERMQRLSYKLTHLYFNWPGTIRVPAPCQYAHKLAYLTGQSLHTGPSEALVDKLFYL